MPFSHRSCMAGFTLIELLVVMTILGLLVALVSPSLVRQAENASPKAARVQIANLTVSLNLFRLDVGRYPTTQEGLAALRQRPSGVDRWNGPYAEKKIPADPWGNGYMYRSPGENRPFELLSYGADGVEGGEDNNADITSWEDDEQGSYG